MTGDTLKFITYGCTEDPIPVHGAGAHAVLGLLGVLLALVLSNVDHQPFEELRVGILAEADRGRFQHAARQRDGIAQVVIDLTVAGEAGDIVDNNDDTLFAMLAQEGEHRLDAAAVSLLAGNVVVEYTNDFVFLEAPIFAAARLL